MQSPQNTCAGMTIEKSPTVNAKTTKTAMTAVSDEELKKTIKDFLEMGHVDNIVSMFKRDASYYPWTGTLLDDERFNVRLGVTILFEELKEIQPDKLELAVPSLKELLKSDSPNIRGEAVGVLGIIGSRPAVALIEMMKEDPHPQVQEMVQLVLEDLQ